MKTAAFLVLLILALGFAIWGIVGVVITKNKTLTARQDFLSNIIAIILSVIGIIAGAWALNVLLSEYLPIPRTIIAGAAGLIIWLVLSSWYVGQLRTQFEQKHPAPVELTSEQKGIYLDNQWLDQSLNITPRTLAIGIPIWIIIMIAVIMDLSVPKEAASDQSFITNNQALSSAAAQPSVIDSVVGIVLPILQMATALLFLAVLGLIIVRFNLIRHLVEGVKDVFKNSPLKK